MIYVYERACLWPPGPELPGNPGALSIKTMIALSQVPMCSKETTREAQSGLVFNLPPSLAASPRPCLSTPGSLLPRRQTHQHHHHPAENSGCGKLTQCGTEHWWLVLPLLPAHPRGPSPSPEGDEASEEQREGQHAQDDPPQAIVHTELAPPHLS